MKGYQDDCDLIDYTRNVLRSFFFKGDRKFPNWVKLHSRMHQINFFFGVQGNCLLAPANLLLSSALCNIILQHRNMCWFVLVWIYSVSKLTAGVNTLFRGTPRVVWMGVGAAGSAADSSSTALTDMICLVQLNASKCLFGRVTIIHSKNLWPHDKKVQQTMKTRQTEAPVWVCPREKRHKVTCGLDTLREIKCFLHERGLTSVHATTI